MGHPDASEKLPYDLVVRGGTCLLPADRVTCDVGIRGGRIAGLGDLASAPTHGSVGATRLHVLPGVIDAQVHFRAPGAPHKEDLATGTTATAPVAASAGGLVFRVPSSGRYYGKPGPARRPPAFVTVGAAPQACRAARRPAVRRSGSPRTRDVDADWHTRAARRRPGLRLQLRGSCAATVSCSNQFSPARSPLSSSSRARPSCSGST